MDKDEKAAVVQEWRRMKGLTVSEAAGVCGVTRTTVWRWERGLSSPPRRRWLEMLEDLAGRGL